MQGLLLSSVEPVSPALPASPASPAAVSTYLIAAGMHRQQSYIHMHRLALTPCLASARGRRRRLHGRLSRVSAAYWRARVGCRLGASGARQVLECWSWSTLERGELAASWTGSW
jgi:hypothetical protein